MILSKGIQFSVTNQYQYEMKFVCSMFQFRSY